MSGPPFTVVWTHGQDAVADPGFPVWGVPTLWGGGYVSKNVYVKMKESGPLGGAHWWQPPGSTNEMAPPSQIPGLNLTQFSNIRNFRPN